MASTLWKRTSEGFERATPLPGAARSGDRRDLAGGFAEIQLSAAALDALRFFAAGHGLDLAAIVAGAWAILLNRYSGDEDVAFGISRTPTPDSSEILPLRVRIPSDCVLLPWLAAINKTLADRAAASSKTMPGPDRDPDEDPVFESVIQFDSPCDSNKIRLPLEISVSPEFRIAAAYDGSRFCEGAVPRILRQLKTLLENVPICAGTNISAVPLMPESELRDLVTDRNSTEIEYRSATCVHRWFEEQVARTPHASAVVFHDESLSYRELDEKADHLAARLRELGAAPDQIVALCVERSIEMVVGLFGILKSGAAYLPLDPTFPPERLQFMLEDSCTSIVVTQEHLITRLPASCTHPVSIRSAWVGPGIAEDSRSPVEAHHLAYVIYTSGSTGRPKGVRVEHRQVSNFFAGMDQVIGPQPGVWLAVTSISFDISVLELFWTLAHGFTVVLQAESEKLGSGGHYSVAAQIARHQVTHLQCTPSMARFLISDEKSFASLRGLSKLMLGGEALPSALVAQLRGMVPGEIFNLYGPTETTVWSLAHRIEQDEEVIPIGRPIANTQVYLVDAHLQPVPFGAAGELVIGGAGVARGYLNRPELTSEKFVPDPFRPTPSNRLYRTGDLARYRPDGNLEFLGRIDNQVKISGFRIEPEEIEAVLGQHPDIRAIAIVAREDAGGAKMLVGYFVTGERSLTQSELRSYAQHRLPAHMVPSSFVALASLPQTPNRKIDKKALAALPLAATPFFVPPANLEETVSNIFREALQVETVSTQANFFDLGANSLVMAQVAIALAEKLNREIPLPELFKYPTIRSLAAYLSQAPQEETSLQRASSRAQSRKDAFLERSGSGRVSNREPNHR